MAAAKESIIPTGRNYLMKTANRWLKFKAQDDAIGVGLWRIHDGLYDLRAYIDKHPGGADWIEMTEGQDITEAFEAAHVRGGKVEKILKKYWVKDTNKPRTSPFTFAPNGFYRTLKAKAEKVLYDPKVGGPGPTFKALILQDILASTCLVLMFIGAWKNSMFWSALAGLVLGMNTSAAHNFFHQADSWRMYYWDLSVLSSRDWRISHMLSHHLHTNTLKDLEVSGIEPYVAFLPDSNKNWIQRFSSQIYINILYFAAFPIEFMKKIVAILVLQEEKLRFPDVIPFIELWAMFIVGGDITFSRCLILWTVVHAMSGYWLIFTSLIASHHHPDIYHAGDIPRKDTDWGLRQMDSTRDVTNKKESYFLVATTFGHHVLHHLFPTVDHSKLHLLYQSLEETCQEFGLSYKTLPQWKMFVGLHLQLMRNQGKENYVK